MQIRPIADSALLRRLLATCGLPVADLEANHRIRFFAAVDGDDLIGVIGLETSPPVGLLRSLAVRTEKRGQGIGAALVAAAETAAQSSGVETLYLLTESAGAFFAGLGYAPLSRESAPIAVRSHPQFTTLCPASARLMTRRLDAPVSQPPAIPH